MAGRYPQQWLDELRARADIVSIVSEYVQLKQTGRRYWGLCPFHGEKTASFSVDSERQAYYCFGCKAGGNVFQFIMDIERMEFVEAVRFLAEKLRLPLPEMENDAEAQKRRTLRERIYEINRKTAMYFHKTLYSPEGAPALEYLHRRGLDDSAIRVFGLGAASSKWDALTSYLLGEGYSLEELSAAGLTVVREEKRFDMFRGRVIFPIISAHGEVLGFGGRALGDVQPKYLNSPDTPAFNKRYNVYAANLLRKARGLKRVILVEGYMDVVSLTRSGVEGVAATLGTALTEDQAKLLKRYAPEIWVAYDGDSAGQKAILRALDILEPLEIPARVLVFPDKQDPDEFIRAHGREAFEQLAPVSAPVYRMQRAADGLDLSREEDRTKYAIACAEILRGVRQPVERENLLKRLMVDTGYSRDVLLSQIGMAPEPVRAAQQTAARSSAASGVSGAGMGAPAAFVSEQMKAERTLLSLMSVGKVQEGAVEPDAFSDPQHRDIARALLEGKSPSQLLEECDPQQKIVLLEIYNYEPQMAGDELQRVITDCLERMRRGWIETRIRKLTENMATATAMEKREMLKEIGALNMEKKRLQPGRKE